MNIVFFSMDSGESERVQDFIKEKLLELHCRDRCITGAQVNFKEQNDKSGAEKVCEIDLTHYGHPVFVRKSAASYEQAARDAVMELARKRRACIGIV